MEERLAAGSAEELRASLRAMAQQTDPSQRRVFLAKLKAPEEPAAVAASQVIEPADLLADIDELAYELEDAMQDAIPWEERYEWDDGCDFEDSLEAYEEFFAPLTALFDRAEAAFDYGKINLAREAYEPLFELLYVEDEYGNGLVPPPPRPLVAPGSMMGLKAQPKSAGITSSTPACSRGTGTQRCNSLPREKCWAGAAAKATKAWSWPLS